MVIRYECQCGRELTAGDLDGGRTARCPSCGGLQQVPDSAPARLRPAPPPELYRCARCQAINLASRTVKVGSVYVCRNCYCMDPDWRPKRSRGIPIGLICLAVAVFFALLALIVLLSY